MKAYAILPKIATHVRSRTLHVNKKRTFLIANFKNFNPIKLAIKTQSVSPNNSSAQKQINATFIYLNQKNQVAPNIQFPCFAIT
jgi:hypothetical protein